jgi:hypothetical protein
MQAYNNYLIVIDQSCNFSSFSPWTWRSTPKSPRDIRSLESVIAILLCLNLQTHADSLLLDDSDDLLNELLEYGIGGTRSAPAAVAEFGNFTLL